MESELRRRLCDRDEPYVEDAYYDGTSRHFFAVDWREDEAEIVEYCAECLELDSLTAEWREGALVIVRDGTETVVPLTDGLADRHIAICTLNDVLQPEYEIRFLVCSHGADTAGFAVFSAAEWRSLEADCPDVVEENFLKLEGLPNIFTELADGDLPIPARARFLQTMNRKPRSAE